MMGAMPWTEIAPWRDNAAEALHEIQARLATNYDLAALIERFIGSTEQTIALEEESGDHFGLLNGWKKYLADLQEAQSKLPPSSPKQRIEILRQIHFEEIGNILDVTGISGEREPFICRPLDEDQLQRICGTKKPTLATAKTAFGNLSGEIDRAESICFPLYDDAGSPVGWFFGGYTAD
jgi:hypothetical protein